MAYDLTPPPPQKPTWWERLEKNPVISIVGFATVIGGLVYGVMNYLHTKDLEYAARDAQARVDEVQRQYTSERSRLTVTLGDGKSPVDSDSLFTTEEKIDETAMYKHKEFPVATPRIFQDKVGWSWTMASEKELADENALMLPSDLRSSLAFRVARVSVDANTDKKLLCYRSENPIVIPTSTEQLLVRPKVFFLKIPFSHVAEMSKDASAASRQFLEETEYDKDVRQLLHYLIKPPPNQELFLKVLRGEHQYNNPLKKLADLEATNSSFTYTADCVSAHLYAAYPKEVYSVFDAYRQAASAKGSRTTTPAGGPVTRYEPNGHSEADRRQYFINQFSICGMLNDHTVGPFTMTECIFRQTAFQFVGYYKTENIPNVNKPPPANRIYMGRLGLRRDDMMYIIGYICTDMAGGELADILHLVTGTRIVL